MRRHQDVTGGQAEARRDGLAGYRRQAVKRLRRGQLGTDDLIRLMQNGDRNQAGGLFEQ